MNVADIVDKDVEFRDNGGVIHMRLKSEQLWRRLGRVDGDEYTKVENANGLHRKTDSFGMPYSLLAWFKSVGIEKIKIVYGGRDYTTTASKWMKSKLFLYFNKKAEKRIYLTKEEFDK